MTLFHVVIIVFRESVHKCGLPYCFQSFLHTDHHRGQTRPLKRIKCQVAHPPPMGFYVNYQRTRFSTSQQTEHNNKRGCHFLSDSSNYQSVTWEIDGTMVGVRDREEQMMHKAITEESDE